MPRRFRRAGSLALAIVCGSAWVIQAQKPAVPDLLKAAADYLIRYSHQLSAVAADEEYVQREPLVKGIRRLQAEFVVVGLDDAAVRVFRDIYAVEGHQVRPRDDRVLKLLQNPSADAQEQARAFADEGVRHYLSPNLNALDNPTAALEFLRAENQGDAEFSLEGVKTQDGVRLTTLKFRVKPMSQVLPVPVGSTTTGRFLLDAASGTVRQSDLTVGSKNLLLRVTTKYAADPTLGLWLPVEMIQQYDLSGETGGLSNMGAGGLIRGKQSLEGRAKYSKYRRLSPS